MKKLLIDKNNFSNNKTLIELIKQSERYFSMPTPQTHPLCSTTYMGMAICNLALTYLVTKDERFLEEAKRFMDAVCGYEKWGNAHLVNVDLSASFILVGLSLGYNWLYDVLSSEEKERYQAKIILQADIMYDYKINNLGNGWPTNYWQNHNWINHTSLLVAGLVLKGYHNAEKWLNEALNNFDFVFKHLASDGSNYEGVTYWRYGGMWLFIPAYIMKLELNRDYFSEVDYFKNTFYYRLYQTDATLLKQHNFGDCHDRYSSHSLFVYYLVANIYNDGYAQSYGDYIFEHIYEEQYQSKVKPGILPEAWLTYLVYNEDIIKKDISSLPKVKYFEDLGLISIRDSWDKDATTFSIKCGYPGGKCQYLTGIKNPNEMALSHHHPDNLSYILNKGNEYFVIDDGYNRNIGIYDHNSLLVDGKLLDVMNKNDCYMASVKTRANKLNYYGEVKDYSNDKNILYAKLDNTLMYPLDLEMEEVSRVIFTNNLDYLLFIDNFKSKKEHSYETHLNSDYYHKEESGYDLYEGLDNKLYHYVIAETKLFKEVNNHIIRSVMTTQEPDNYCQTTLNGVSYKTDLVKDAVVYEILAFSKLNIKMIDNHLIIESEDYIDNIDLNDAIIKYERNKKDKGVI